MASGTYDIQASNDVGFSKNVALFPLGVKLQALHRGWARRPQIWHLPRKGRRHRRDNRPQLRYYRRRRKGCSRQFYPFKHLTLTPLKLSSLPRGAGTKKVRKEVEEEAIIDKWDKSSLAQKRVAVQKRRTLTDFGRFSIMLAKKQQRDLVRKGVAKA
ncbi:hypothetical protein K443DRAFT_275908 [Laccaria amethystina LaAM-08-1]|uniref:Large ribosomal subunit protein eL14 domain-containing protein n=1 Tax=Laccaria amethystina LaAM-08-1 TaxID=1095629 RepID=A0A0C9XG53_9AGAR|nr:hypothetical protein K443DRAFT_275908 [Laccaria amethystina LaAM-08-1]